jgi:hypothetical protein
LKALIAAFAARAIDLSKSGSIATGKTLLIAEKLPCGQMRRQIERISANYQETLTCNTIGAL